VGGDIHKHCPLSNLDYGRYFAKDSQNVYGHNISVIFYNQRPPRYDPSLHPKTSKLFVPEMFLVFGTSHYGMDEHRHSGA